MSDEQEHITLSEGDSTCRNCGHDPHHSDEMCNLNGCMCKNYVPTKWAIVASQEPVFYKEESYTCPDCGHSFTVSGISFLPHDEHRGLILGIHKYEDCTAWFNRLKFFRYRWKDRKMEKQAAGEFQEWDDN